MLGALQQAGGRDCGAEYRLKRASIWMNENELVGRLQGRGVAAVADLGGSIITGIDGNPLATLVKQVWDVA